MRGPIGILVGIAFLALGLGGLSLALFEMMSHADPNAGLKAIAGLATFLAVCVLALVSAR
jgi:hypothetical protein